MEFSSRRSWCSLDAQQPGCFGAAGLLSVRVAWGFIVLGALSTQNAFALDFKVSPAKIVFDRNFEQAQLLVTATDAAGASNERSEDLTSKAAFASSNPAVVAVTPAGRLLGLANGDAVVTV